MTDNKNSKSPGGERMYRSPQARVVFVKMRGILCLSETEFTGEKYITEMEEGNDNW